MAASKPMLSTITRRQEDARKRRFVNLDAEISDDEAQVRTEYHETLTKETFLGVKQLME